MSKDILPEEVRDPRSCMMCDKMSSRRDKSNDPIYERFIMTCHNDECENRKIDIDFVGWINDGAGIKDHAMLVRIIRGLVFDAVKPGRHAAYIEPYGDDIPHGAVVIYEGAECTDEEKLRDLFIKRLNS